MEIHTTKKKRLLADMLKLAAEAIFRPVRKSKIMFVKELDGDTAPHRHLFLSPHQKMAGILARSPEVMVKVSGVSRDCQALLAHAAYISRNGKTELIDEEDADIYGRKEVSERIEEWRFCTDMPYSGGKKREAYHIVLSMPPGTDRDGVKRAAFSFGETVFCGRKWLMAEHRDGAHPHVHFIVLSKGEDGLRLNPRKADLQAWREVFAAKLNEQGISANATKRFVRGQFKRRKKQAVFHLDKRGAAAAEKGVPEKGALTEKGMQAAAAMRRAADIWAGLFRSRGGQKNNIAAGFIRHHFHSIFPVKEVEKEAVGKEMAAVPKKGVSSLER